MKIGMVALKARKNNHVRMHEATLAGASSFGVSSPCEGHEIEYLIDLIKSLQNIEGQLEKAKEKLIMRCPEFNNREALKLFEPPEDLDENLHFFNVKKAFRKVNLSVETFQAKQIVRRFDSNFDEELSFSDIHDIFKTDSQPINHELERRTVFATSDDDKQL